MTERTQFECDVACELAKARQKFAPLNSAHEAYAVILEELDEFWQEVRKKRAERDPAAMYAELVQIAAMCERTALDLKLCPQAEAANER